MLTVQDKTELLVAAANLLEKGYHSPYSCDAIRGAAAIAAGGARRDVEALVNEYTNLFAPESITYFWLTSTATGCIGYEEEPETMRDVRVLMLCLLATLLEEGETFTDPEIEALAREQVPVYEELVPVVEEVPETNTAWPFSE